MRKNIVRLTEQGLRSLVSETVKKCLFEASEKAKIKNRLYRIVEPFTHSIYDNLSRKPTVFRRGMKADMLAT